MSFVIICVFTLLSGCGAKAPSEQQIMEDLEEEITTISIQNPFTYEMEEQELEIVDIEIEKSQTKDSSYKADCIIEMENEYYSFTKYIECEYERYDRGKWFLENYREFEEEEYVVRENPFAEEDFISKRLGFIDFYNLVVDMSFERDIVSISCSYEVDYEYMTKEINIYEEYSFAGNCWDSICYDETTNSNWNVEGVWELSSPKEGERFQLVMEAFDSDSLTGSGICGLGYKPWYNWNGNWEEDTYSISDAVIYEEEDALYIFFDGDAERIYASWNTYIKIEGDEAVAHYANNWWEKITLSRQEISSTNEQEKSKEEYSLIDNSIVEPEYYKSNCLVVNGDIMCWGGATHSWDVNGKRYSSTTSVLEFVYSGENLQSMNWYHILESEEQARDLAIYVYENDGVCWGYEGKIKASYCGNVLKIEESISTVDESHQTRNGNIAYYQSWGFDIIYM